MLLSQKSTFFERLLIISAWVASFAVALPTPAVVTEITSFAVPRSPSGMFFDEPSNLLYVLCGTNTNGDHYLYAFSTEGVEQCAITIPEAVGMSRVDGFYIVGDKAYIVDSQGPIYADAGRLGGSVYEIEWTDPCGCGSGTCESTAVNWSPTVTKQWSLSASDISNEEGGSGTDEYFRNSGIVVVDGSFYGVNGVHPINGDLTGSYTKSIAKVDLESSEVVASWPFDGDTIGRNVDMEGLTCGQDQCVSSLFIGDEYNYIYKMDLETGEVTKEWDLREISNVFRSDKGIEALTFASTTGYFYAGIQDTAMVHVVELDGEGITADVTADAAESPTSDVTAEESASDGISSQATVSAAVLAVAAFLSWF